MPQTIEEVRLQKTEAERDRIRFEIEKAKVEAQEREEKSALEIDKLKLENEKAKADLEERTIELNAKKRAERKVLAQNEYHHQYYFTSTVGQESSTKCMDQLSFWERTDPADSPKEIEIIFTSPGGDVIAGMALFDYIQVLKTKGYTITTTAIGYAASMAGILLQVGDVRKIGRESYLLIHQVSFGAIGSFGDIEDTVEWVKKLQDRILDIFAAKSTFTKDELRDKWERKDWWISSIEALEYGFVDEIIG